MNDENALPVITLSREELLAVLDALAADAIPGLDGEPTGELTPEQTAFAVVVARRGLLARGLAQVGPDGRWRLPRSLLNAVGACAYPDESVIVHTWEADAAAPARLFGHTRGDVTVAHTRPDPVLHRFALLPSRSALLRLALDFCRFDAGEPVAPLDVTLPQPDFAAARALAEAGDTAAVAAALVGCGASEAGAAGLAAAWAAGPRVSVLQIAAVEGRAVRAREFTLTQSGPAGWWAAVAPPFGADAPARVRSVSAAALAGALGA